MDNKHLPIPRKFKPGQKATLEDLIWGRAMAAKLVLINPRTLPLFKRFDREILEYESRLLDIERARNFAKMDYNLGSSLAHTENKE